MSVSSPVCVCMCVLAVCIVNYCNWFSWLADSRGQYRASGQITADYVLESTFPKILPFLCLCVYMCMCVQLHVCVFVFVCACVVRRQPGELVWVKVLAGDFSYNEQGEEPMMRNHLFINRREDEMEQPVLNLKTAKLSKPRLPSPRHPAAICWR